MKKNNINDNDIILEDLQPSHAIHLYEMMQDDRIYTYIPENAPAAVETLKEKYKMFSKGSLRKEEVWLNYAIYLSSEKLYIGTLQATVQLDKRIISIAYILDPKKWGAGYAKKALSIMLQNSKEQFGHFDYYAYIDTRNERSINLVKSLGFKCVEYIENADYFKGSSSNEFVYAKISNK
ncbi:GNAT family N-acetyltransferase [Bacillus badius]|uniref:N-acetyltransferase domain-containing protein n=1 Tax=Bacillus badius TaxID=1455 RepID=A0ABR5AS71_BACBA|nr:GNAT family protein [Bacillus badius]KIL77460.1 hypothetical protein SD77_1446 [Bacillus badius]KZN98236.1 hypothetical protein A4244_10790 [Bacillus badius]KZR58522.1 hypothetical protein A3781_16645 [Bacillus badius]MED0667600.1 GNAT family protein [Bacillus badius]MED4717206.1 GNAT family protein [Bacillus badius]